MPNSSQEVTLLNSKELAVKLGVPINTIYYWVSKSDIPYVKLGKHNRFNYEEVIEYFQNRTKQKRDLK